MEIFKVERTGYPSLLDTSKVEVYNLCSNKCDCAFSSQIVGKTYREKRSNKRNVHEVPYISPKGIPLEVTLKASAFWLVKMIRFLEISRHQCVLRIS